MENESCRIRFTPLAYDDLDEIDSYITETLCNEPTAEKLLTEIECAVNKLCQFPYLGSEVEDAYLAAKGYRKLVVENYLVFHLINRWEKEVIIMRILYGAREYHHLL